MMLEHSLKLLNQRRIRKAVIRKKFIPASKRIIVTYLLACLLTYLIAYSMKQSPFWEANRFSAGQEIPRAFYGTRRFFTAFTSARHLTLSSASSIQPMPPHPSSQRSAL